VKARGRAAYAIGAACAGGLAACAQIGGLDDFTYVASDDASSAEAGAGSDVGGPTPVAVTPDIPSGADGDPVLVTPTNGATALFLRGRDGVVRFGDLSISGAGIDAWRDPGLPTAVSDPAVGVHLDGSRSAFIVTASGDLVGVDEEPDGGWTAPRVVASNVRGDLAIDDHGYPMAVLARAGTALVVVPVEGDAGAAASLDGSLAGSPALAYNEDGRAEVFALTGDGTIVHQWRIQPEGAFAGTWASLGGTFVGDPAVLEGSDLLMVLAAVDTSGTLRVWKQGQANGPFVVMPSIDGPFEPPAVLAMSPSGSMLLAVRSATGEIATYEWSVPLSAFASLASPSMVSTDAKPALGVKGTGTVVVVRTGVSLLESMLDTTAQDFAR